MLQAPVMLHVLHTRNAEHAAIELGLASQAAPCLASLRHLQTMKYMKKQFLSLPQDVT
jgi:hypothetical protein